MLENNTYISNNLTAVNSKYINLPENYSGITQQEKSDSVEISAENKKQEPKDKQIKPKHVIIAAASLGMAGLITLLGVVTRARGLNKKADRIIKKGLQNSEHADKILNFTRLKENLELSAKEGRILKFTNLMNNSANIKDCYLAPFLQKFPILRGFAKKTSQMYTNTGVKMTQSAYKHASSTYGALDLKILNALDSDEIRKLIEKRNILIDSNFGTKELNARVGKIQEIMNNVGEKGIAVEVRDTFSNLIKEFIKSKGKDREGFFKFVAEDMVKDQKAQYIKELADMRKAILSADDEILEALKGKIDDETYKNIGEAFKKSQKSLNNAIRTEGNDLFDKIRDIEIGSAPNDILGMFSTAGMLGIYLAQAEDKNQRVEAALTTGVPLGLGMLATTFATMKMYTGMKAMGFGAVATFIANNIGKIINREYQKRNNIKPQELDIPTLDSAVDNLKNKITNAPEN